MMKKNVNEEIILQNDEHDVNIDLDRVVSEDIGKIILPHISCIISFEFNQFDCVCYLYY